jgi:hypothetical protein
MAQQQIPESLDERAMQSLAAADHNAQTLKHAAKLSPLRFRCGRGAN